MFCVRKVILSDCGCKRWIHAVLFAVTEFLGEQ
jgi:hypothetical protein